MKPHQKQRAAGFLAAVLTSAFVSHAQVWTFETSVPTTAGPHAPEVGSGSASGFHAGATAYSNPNGNGSAESFTSTGWAVGDYWQFQISTIGQGGFLNLAWHQTSAALGPRDFEVRYSTDGTSFSPLGAYTVLENSIANGGTWNASTVRPAYALSMDTSAILGGLTGLPSVYFRLVDISTVSASGGIVDITGQNRIDNFSITATAIPEPQSYMVAGALGLVGLGCWRRFRR